MRDDTTRRDIVMSIDRLEGCLEALIEAVQANTAAVDRWGAEIEDRLSHIEGELINLE